MRRLLTLLVLAALTLPAWGNSTLVVRRPATGGAAAPFDLLDRETFDTNPGYDEAAWTETAAGATADEDETATCPVATGFSSQCMETSTAADNKKYMTAYTFPAGAQAGNVYCRVYFDITDTTGFDSLEDILFAAISRSAATPDSSSTALRMFFKNNAGTLEIRGNCLGNNFGTTTVLANTAYRLEMHVNETSNICDFKLDGTAKGPYTVTGAGIPPTSDPTIMNIGIGTAIAQQSDLVWDDAVCDTRSWIGSQ